MGKRPLLVAALMVACAAPQKRPSAEGLTEGERQALVAALLTQVAEGGINHTHALRLLRYARPFAEAHGADVAVVEAGALLHDATKERPTSDPKARLCEHGDHGAAFAQQEVTKLGRPEAFAEAVSRAIREHMGPSELDPVQGRHRFMTRFCGRAYPQPSTPEAQVLYDIDMLDLMTVDGVLKVTTLRQQNPEFQSEPLRASADTGSESAWRSVDEAGRTLLTPAAKACGEKLVAHSRAFLDGMNWDEVKDLGAFAAAVAAYKGAHPLPSCLPQG